MRRTISLTISLSLGIADNWATRASTAFGAQLRLGVRAVQDEPAGAIFDPRLSRAGDDRLGISGIDALPAGRGGSWRDRCFPSSRRRSRGLRPASALSCSCPIRRDRRSRLSSPLPSRTREGPRSLRLRESRKAPSASPPMRQCPDPDSLRRTLALRPKRSSTRRISRFLPSTRTTRAERVPSSRATRRDMRRRPSRSRFGRR